MIFMIRLHEEQEIQAAAIALDVCLVRVGQHWRALIPASLLHTREMNASMKQEIKKGGRPPFSRRQSRSA
ncbi:hypothetical protein [Noviherbaspirillum galbum]|uniref:Uncharacterized protein n=1 Tax=Noviherbaspirillum galbum TaxID=2709383 RepID=A0A6B3SMM2_9BURK|nr:hypothetical protein [Noviherbaspirillum galbum]NEX59956.1 hypothetical protein [Noviherbaspirillum galbum]